MINKLVKVTLLCLFGVFLGCIAVVYAQEPDEEEPIAVAPSGQLNLTLEQLGYDTYELNRERNTRYYNIKLPGNFQMSPTGNYFDLVTYHLPEVPDKPSALKVRVNERLLSVIPLTKSNAISNTTRIILTDDLLQTGYNLIQIDLRTSATCEDPGAIVDVFIDQTSTLGFGYQQTSYPADLSLYPFPFVEESLLGIPVTLVLPDHPTPDDLRAAATVAAGLGQMSGGMIDLTVALANELGPDDIRRNNHLIVIGKPDDNALLDDLELPLPINSARLDPGQGILEEIVSPWNEFRLILVVSGLDDEAVLKASHALNREAHFLGMQGPVAIVTQLRSVSQSVAPRMASITLASLGYEDRVVYGAQSQNFTYQFRLPLGWHLEDLPFFTFKFSHADILDPYESAIDLTLNGVPVGSTLLDQSNTMEGELTVSFPRRLLKSGRNRLVVGVEMNFPEASRDKCMDLSNKRAWTVISSESEVFLPYTTLDLPPDLSLFPFPFGQNTGFDQTLFILPDQPSPLILYGLFQLAVRFGSASQTTEHISTHIAYASKVDQRDQNNYHLVLLGRPTENALLRAANAHLPQPFAPDSNVLEPLVIDNVAFLPDPERDAGLLEISASPWNEKYSLLAITGTTDEGVRLALQTLLESSNSLEGNLAVVEPAFLSNEPNQVRTYAIDTRPPTAISEGMSPDDTSSESDLSLLAEHWWR